MGVIDATGASDIDCNQLITGVRPGQAVRLATGLRVDTHADWQNDSGVWYTGAKRLLQLLPNSAVQTRVKHAAQADALSATEEAHANAAAALAALASAADMSAESGKLDAGKLAAMPTADRTKLLEAHATEAVLKQRLSDLKDRGHGPVLDVLAWQPHVDADWTVALYTAPGKPPLVLAVHPDSPAPFTRLDAVSQANISVRVYTKPVLPAAGVDGATPGCATRVTVSCAIEVGSHGTHVAGIAAAYEPSQPNGARSGLAPGAQVLSVTIGDRGLGSLETAQGQVRAVQAVINSGAQVINMSYGEPGLEYDCGRFMEAIAAAVDQRGVTFVTSASNDGPALSTTGAAASVTDRVISVAALAARKVTRVALSTAGGDLPALQHFTWSSRGPSPAGHRSVNVSAPGAAFTSIPTWNLSAGTYMNGTSMASPATAGAVAVLLSAAQQAGIPANPYTVRRALEASAVPVPGAEPWAAGAGCVHVPGAFIALQRLARHAASALLTWLAQEDASGTAWSAPAALLDAIAHVDRATSEVAAGCPELTLPASHGGWTAGSQASVAHTSPWWLDCGVSGPFGLGWALPTLRLEGNARGCVPGSHGSGSYSPGIYLRDDVPLTGPVSVSLHISQQWRYSMADLKAAVQAGNDEAALWTETMRRFHTKWQGVLRLSCDAAWVEVPDTVMLAGADRGFQGVVHPQRLEPGVHYATIVAKWAAADHAEPWDLPPAALLPVTVVVPEPVVREPGSSEWVYHFVDKPELGEAGTRSDDSAWLSCSMGGIRRRFLTVPAGATWASVVCTTRATPDGAAHDETDTRGSAGHWLATNWVQAGTSNKFTAHRRVAMLRAGESQAMHVPVAQGRVLEVTHSLNWQVATTQAVRIAVVFRGVHIDGVLNGTGVASGVTGSAFSAAAGCAGEGLAFASHAMPAAIHVTGMLHTVPLLPKLSLTTVTRVVRASHAFLLSPQHEHITAAQRAQVPAISASAGRQRTFARENVQLVRAVFDVSSAVAAACHGDKVKARFAMSPFHGQSTLYDAPWDGCTGVVQDITHAGLCKLGSQIVPGLAATGMDMAGLGMAVGTFETYAEEIELQKSRKYLVTVDIALGSEELAKAVLERNSCGLLQLSVTTPLKSAIALDLYNRRTAAMLPAGLKVPCSGVQGIKLANNVAVPAGMCRTLWAAAPSASSLQSAGVAAGDVLCGKLQLANYKRGKVHAGSVAAGVGCASDVHPTGHLVRLFVTGDVAKPDSVASKFERGVLRGPVLYKEPSRQAADPAAQLEAASSDEVQDVVQAGLLAAVQQACSAAVAAAAQGKACLLPAVEALRQAANARGSAGTASTGQHATKLLVAEIEAQLDCDWLRAVRVLQAGGALGEALDLRAERVDQAMRALQVDACTAYLAALPSALRDAVALQPAQAQELLDAGVVPPAESPGSDPPATAAAVSKAHATAMSALSTAQSLLWRQVRNGAQRVVGLTPSAEQLAAWRSKLFKYAQLGGKASLTAAAEVLPDVAKCTAEQRFLLTEQLLAASQPTRAYSVLQAWARASAADASSEVSVSAVLPLPALLHALTRCADEAGLAAHPLAEVNGRTCAALMAAADPTTV